MEQTLLGRMLHHQVLIYVFTNLPKIREIVQNIDKNLENLQVDLRESFKKLMVCGTYSVEIEDFEESASTMSHSAFTISGRTRVKRKRVPTELTSDVNLLVNNLLDDMPPNLYEQMIRDLCSTLNSIVMPENGEARFKNLLFAAYEKEIRATFTKYGGKMNWICPTNEHDTQNRSEKTEISEKCCGNAKRSVFSRFVDRLEEAFFSMFRL